VVGEETHIAAGRYTDEITRQPDGRWLFTERKVTFFFWGSLADGWRPGQMAWPPAAAVDARYRRN
jgi:hypothetical protein